jgi:hypothetical protein
MTRLTKYLVAAAVVAGFAVASQTASAHPPQVIVHPTIKPYPTYRSIFPQPYPPVVAPVLPRHDHDYLLQYRPSPFGGWVTYGKFETRYGAETAQRRLEWQGVPTRVIRLHDYFEPPHRW